MQLFLVYNSKLIFKTSSRGDLQFLVYNIVVINQVKTQHIDKIS